MFDKQYTLNNIKYKEKKEISLYFIINKYSLNN